MIRITTTFSGRVQGVGFRYTTQRIAQGFAVGGYVMNLPDGRVDMVVEADKKEAHAFAAAVKEAMGLYISDTRQATGAPSGEFGDVTAKNSFTIRY